MALTPAYFFELDDGPHLAVIDILDHVLHVTEQAVLCAHRELAAGEDPESPDVQLWIADTMVEQIHHLRRTLRCYRQITDRNND